MDARKQLIAKARDAAFDAARAGKDTAVVLRAQAMDPTSLLEGAGFPGVRYDAATGDVTAAWGGAVQESAEPMARCLLALTADMQELPALAQRVKFLEHVRTYGLGRTINLDHMDEPRARALQRRQLEAILAPWGWRVTGEKHDAGDYHDSSMGGWWRRHPSSTYTLGVEEEEEVNTVASTWLGPRPRGAPRGRRRSCRRPCRAPGA